MADNNLPLCELTDNLRPIPFRKGEKTVSIRSIRHFVEVIQNLALRKPRMVILAIPTGPQLFIGLAGKVAAVRAYPNPPSGRSWSAIPDSRYSSEDLWVTSEGEPSKFRADCVMPLDDVIAIVSYVLEHRDLPDTVSWINVKGEKFCDEDRAC
jgi:Immunity protein Imm1